MMHLISLVKNLVRQYIKARNCIVLLALSMTDDATNSSATRIVKDVLGARERTVGILTKPDRIQSGEDYQQWIEILHSNKFSVGYKYYVVRSKPLKYETSLKWNRDLYQDLLMDIFNRNDDELLLTVEVGA